MKNSTQHQKILWAVDAFDHTNASLQGCARYLKAVAPAFQAEIEPVYLLSPDQLNLRFELTFPFTERYLPAAKSALEMRLQGLEIPGLLPPQILVQNRPSLRASAERLLGYADSGGFSALVVGTHGRSGLGRMVLGSFAEELLLQARIPVTVIGEKSPSSNISEILYPTDFGDTSYETFVSLLDLAAQLRARITVLHSIPRVVELFVHSSMYLLGGGWVPVPELQEKELAGQHDLASRWQELAAKRDVKVDVVFDSESTSVTQAILKRSAPDLIAMEAQSGRIASTLIGSITRQIVRTATCPVWVIRNRSERK